MIMSRFKPFYLISGGVVVLSTVLFYFLLLDTASPIFGLSLGFMLLAEVILFLIAAYGAASIVRVGLISVSIFHLLFTILLSFLYFHFEFSIQSYILWNILLLAAVYLIDTYLTYSFRKFRAGDEEVHRAQSVVHRCTALAQTLADSYTGSPYNQQLKLIYEDLRYSDNTALTGLEDRIYDLLSQLQWMLDHQEEEEQVMPHIERIRQVLSERTQHVKQIKIGKF